MPEDPELQDDREQTLPDPDDEMIGWSDDEQFEDVEEADEADESVDEE